MTYVEGFVVAVPTDKKDAYRKHAAEAAPMFQEFGAARMVEAWGDDVQHGKVTDFYRAVQAKEDETVVFSWVEWPSKEARDKGNAAVATDPRTMQAPEELNLMDPKRMIYGGFVPVVDEKGA